jgi:hypothetical protein
MWQLPQGKCHKGFSHFQYPGQRPAALGGCFASNTLAQPRAG